MIKILYLFLFYLPLVLVSLTNFSFLLLNSFYYSIIPLVNLYDRIVPYPYYYDIIVLCVNYILCNIFYIIKSKINYEKYSWSKFINTNIKYLTSNFSLFIFLGVEYIWRFNNIMDSIFGLFLLTISYLYYPILHRIYFGRNNRTWKRKIDYYYSYYKETKQYNFIYDILEGIVLGLLFIGFYYEMKYIKYVYSFFGLLKLLYHFIKPIDYNYNCKGKYYYNIQYIFILISGSLVYLDIYLDFMYLFLVNGLVQLLHNLLFLYLNPPKKLRLIVRESLDLPDIYFDNL